MDEFLEKLAEDQRRMREYFGSQSARFKKMGATLGTARERLSRIFLVGEPPVDRVAYLISIEYFLGLPVVLLSVDDKPPTGGEVSKHLARFFKKGDVVVIVANAGQNETLKALFAIAKKKGTHAMLVGGLDAREQWRKLADSAVSLPTRGLRTVCEASLIVARILARCARSYLRDKTGKEEEERIFRADCEKCAHPVFFELQQRGKKTICPHCREPMRSVRSARTSDAPPPAPPSMRIKLPDKTTKKRKREELEAKAAGKDDESQKKPEGEGQDRKPRPNLKQSVVNIPVTQVAEFMDESPAEAAIPFDGADPPEIETPNTTTPAGEGTGELETPQTASPPETIIAPEDLAFDELAGNATKTPDPFALPNAFVSDLVMPQGRPATGGKTPSDENPATSGETLESAASSGSGSSGTDQRGSSRLVSARYTVQDCRVRYGMGGFPGSDDEGPDHPLDRLSQTGLVFYLDPKDEVGATIEKGDELWITLAIPAFLEPVHVRGNVAKIGGASDGNRAGIRIELEWKDLDPAVGRKLARAAENLGLPA